MNAPAPARRPAVYAVCALEEIPNRRARAFVLARAGADGAPRPWPIFILRWGRHVRAYENRCPHQGVHLDWERGEFLDGEGIRIQCGKHGALFDLGTGACVAGPCLGEGLVPIEAVIEEGEICLAGVDLLEDEDEDSGQGAE
ncbi:MAG TPA: Rieske 2Fe-2S domain-containing protein [Novosphingobium sp.]|nr:Rieske 2Fe-2S domain-containing protein [Novosphingobium sp.]